MKKNGWALLCVVLSTVVNAAIGTPSYSTPVYGTGVAYVTGSLMENSCTTSCSETFTVTLAGGYTNSASAIVIRNYYLDFADASAGRVNHAKLSVVRNSYNTSTGVFSWTVEADLSAADPVPSNTTFNWGVEFAIVLGDNTNFRATAKTASNFETAGGGAPCDSSAECSDPTPYSGVGTSGAPFRQMVLRSFDVSTSSGNGLELNQLRFDVATVIYNSDTSTTGEAWCTASGRAGDAGIEELTCELGMVAFAFPLTHLTNQTAGSFIDGKTSFYSDWVTTNSASSTNASAFINALQASDQEWTGGVRSPVNTVQSGCGNWFFYSSPGTGSTGGWAKHGLIEPGTPSLTYASYVQCFNGFIY